jgi:hypothetical protein
MVHCEESDKLIESHSVRSLEQEIIAEMIKGRSFVGSRGDNSYSSNQSTSKSNNQSMTQREDNLYIHDHMDNISRNQRLKHVNLYCYQHYQVMLEEV